MGHYKSILGDQFIKNNGTSRFFGKKKPLNEISGFLHAEHTQLTESCVIIMEEQEMLISN